MKSTAIQAGLVALACASLASPAQAAEPPRDDSRYLYALTKESAVDCALMQQTLSTLKQPTDHEWYRRHFAMALTWQAVAEKLNGGPLPDSFYETRAKVLEGMEAPGLDDIAEVAFFSHPCEVMRNIHNEYYEALDSLESQHAEIFADKAALKNQTGADTYSDPPEKSLAFGDWKFVARGNACTATHTFKDGAVLRLAFTNFFDGLLAFEWKKLPRFDNEADDYVDQFQRHLVGVDYDEETYARILTPGVTYANFKGTALFIDREIVASLNAGSTRTHGTSYFMGESIQRTYYHKFPAGHEVTIKVLGKETHKVSIDDPAMWNEISNCMGQYPFG